jgi:hypothetical protein
MAASSTIDVSMSVDGKRATYFALEPGSGWVTPHLTLPPRTAGRFTRIDIETFLPGGTRPDDADHSSSNGVLMVGRPQFMYRDGPR